MQGVWLLWPPPALLLGSASASLRLLSGHDSSTRLTASLQQGTLTISAAELPIELPSPFSKLACFPSFFHFLRALELWWSPDVSCHSCFLSHLLLTGVRCNKSLIFPTQLEGGRSRPQVVLLGQDQDPRTGRRGRCEQWPLLQNHVWVQGLGCLWVGLQEAGQRH